MTVHRGPTPAAVGPDSPPPPEILRVDVIDPESGGGCSFDQSTCDGLDLRRVQIDIRTRGGVGAHLYAGRNDHGYVELIPLEDPDTFRIEYQKYDLPREPVSVSVVDTEWRRSESVTVHVPFDD